jgi:hypothetical protein
MICLEYKAFNDYYFCPQCYSLHKKDILSKAKWVEELKRIFWREQKREKKVKQNEVLLGDLGLTVGDDSELYYNGEYEEL